MQVMSRGYVVASAAMFLSIASAAMILLLSVLGSIRAAAAEPGGCWARSWASAENARGRCQTSNNVSGHAMCSGDDAVDDRAPCHDLAVLDAGHLDIRPEDLCVALDQPAVADQILLHRWGQDLSLE